MVSEMDKLEILLVDSQIQYEEKRAALKNSKRQKLVDEIAQTMPDVITFTKNEIYECIDELYSAEHLDYLISNLPDSVHKQYLVNNRKYVHTKIVKGTLNRREEYFVHSRRCGFGRAVVIAKIYAGYGQYVFEALPKSTVNSCLEIPNIYGTLDVITNFEQMLTNLQLSYINTKLPWPRRKDIYQPYRDSLERLNKSRCRTIQQINQMIKRLQTKQKVVEQMIEYNCLDKVRRKKPTIVKLSKIELSLLKNKGVLVVSQKYKLKTFCMQFSRCLGEPFAHRKRVFVPLTYRADNKGIGLYMTEHSSRLYEVCIYEYSGDPLLGMLEINDEIKQSMIEVVDNEMLYFYVSKNKIVWADGKYIEDSNLQLPREYEEDAKELPVRGSGQQINFIFRHEPSNIDYFMYLGRTYAAIYAKRLC